MISVEFYKSRNAQVPAIEFLQTLDPKLKVKVYAEIKMLEEFGNQLCEPYSKYLRNGIFELRIQSGRNTARCMYFFYIDNKAVITHRFMKKTRKTPLNEIEKAERYRKDWLERNGYERKQ